ncbi:MAG: hypothetical protein KDC66_10370, partial [Phaeodactylibacter sp.]|nr:hypothetical protein [Phaeodactylibacter sp.]
ITEIQSGNLFFEHYEVVSKTKREACASLFLTCLKVHVDRFHLMQRHWTALGENSWVISDYQWSGEKG